MVNGMYVIGITSGLTVKFGFPLKDSDVSGENVCVMCNSVCFVTICIS